MKAFDELVETFSDLMGPKGCPWDQKQTMKTIRCDLLEECHELLDAISLDDNAEMCEELGDLFAVLVFLGKLAEKEGRFQMVEALSGINEKLIRRHPHVFGDSSVETEDELYEQWNRIKKTEVGKESRKSVLDGIPTDLPALARAQKVQKKAKLSASSQGGLDPELQLAEELWALVGKARELELDAEQALRRLLAHKEREFRACEAESTPVDS